jgi:NifU-like protein involved in Fe-S cluster formation
VSDADPRYGAEVRARMASLAGAGGFAPSPQIARGRAGDREHGAEVVLAGRVVAGRVEELRFQAFGCPHLVAAASWLTDRLRGASREDLLRWDWREAADVLAVPPAKYGRLLTLQDAVRAVAGNWPGATASTV